MIKPPIDQQDLRRRIYVKAKAEPSWRFWGLYVHVCKVETLRAAYAMAKQNDGAPGIDGVTFEAIEAQGVEALLEQLRDELTGCTYKPLPARKQEIPKDGGKVRVLSGMAARGSLGSVRQLPQLGGRLRMRCRDRLRAKYPVTPCKSPLQVQFGSAKLSFIVGSLRAASRRKRRQQAVCSSSPARPE